MRILVLSRYGPLGSASRLRFYQYLPHLEAAGVQAEVSFLLDDGYVRRLYAGERQPLSFLLRAYRDRLRALTRARAYDLLWVEKEFLPWVPAVSPPLLPTPYVVDYDDAVFHRYDLHRSLFIRALLGRKIDRVMRGARLVIAGNDYLAARARRAGARQVEILPTVIDRDRYHPASPEGEGPMQIGWIGAPVTAGYLLAIEPVLRHFIEDGRAELTVIGAADPFEGRFPVRTVPWTEDTEAAALARLHVGIMPLPDEPFERGKCGYKLIQYMGAALPVVASPVGVNTAIVEEGVSGYLASSLGDWTRALTLLETDPGLRARLGQAGRRKVAEAYSLESAAPRLLELLRSAVEAAR